jgi:hypothetical protein
VIVGLMRLAGQRVYRLENDWKLWLLAVVPWAFVLSAPRELVARLLGLPWPAQAILTVCVLGGVTALLVSDFRHASRGLSFETAQG